MNVLMSLRTKDSSTRGQRYRYSGKQVKKNLKEKSQCEVISFLLKESSSRSVSCKGRLTTWEQHDPRPASLTQAGWVDSMPDPGPLGTWGTPGLGQKRHGDGIPCPGREPGRWPGTAVLFRWTRAEQPTASDASRVISLDESGQPCLPRTPDQPEGLGPHLNTVSAGDHWRCLWLGGRSGQ